MRRGFPWLRTLVALPLGIVAIEAFHRLMQVLLPRLYASPLDADTDRLQMLLLTTIAGVTGSFVVAVIARHRLWLHMAIFLLVMLAIDSMAITSFLAPQPPWFKAWVLILLPAQAWIGGGLAQRTCRRAFAATA